MTAFFMDLKFLAFIVQKGIENFAEKLKNEIF